MNISYLQNKFNILFLPLLMEDSNERNKNFKKIIVNDIYDLVYLSSGMCGLFFRNNSLKLLNKYILYMKQTNYENEIIYTNFLIHIYNFLIIYDCENKDVNTILSEINHKMHVYINLENFSHYINNDPNISEVLNKLCK